MAYLPKLNPKIGGGLGGFPRRRAETVDVTTGWANWVSPLYDSVSFSVATEDTLPFDIAFSIDGTKMYIVGDINNTVFQYTLSTGWNLSTASYDSISLSVATEDTAPHGIAFNIDATKMYIVGTSNDTVFQYSAKGI